MRVCFICNEYPPQPHGGIGTFVQTVGRRLVEAGVSVRVVGVAPNGSKKVEVSEDCGVEVIRLRRCRVPSLGWVRTRATMYSYVSDAAKNHEIDLVEVPDYEGWSAGWPRLAVPVVVRYHGSASYFATEAGNEMGRLLFLLERGNLRRADFHCSSSRYTAQKTQEVFNLKGLDPVVIYNPITVPATPPWSPAGSRVVFTGTLAVKKGVVPLIQAWNKVRRDHPYAELHLYGRDGKAESGGSMMSHLLEQLDPGAEECVWFHGNVSRDEVMRVLRSARVAVFPSFSEAFGLAPLEAMSQGCPTVFSTRSSGPELIRDGEDGILIDPDDSNGLARTICRLLDSQREARELGEAGWRRVRDTFSMDVVIQQNIRFYESCVAEFRGRGSKPLLQ